MKYKVSSLKKLTISASIWTITEIFIIRSLRFFSNIILTRLLAPEMFGLMQLVMIFSAGLELLSDFGVKVNIIQHAKGDDKEFLRTAWSFQVLRGLALWVISIFISAPFADFYNHSELKLIISVSCFSTVLTGLISTNIFAYQKYLKLRQISLIKIAASLIAYIIMILIAVQYRTIWALVSYGLISSFIFCVLSHLVPGCRMKLTFNKQYFSEIVNFGKWLVLSSLLTLAYNSMDKLYLGKIVSTELLGFYGIGSSIVMVLVQIMIQYQNNVLLPVYRKLIEENLKTMRRKMFKIRLTIQACFLPCFSILVIWGQEICDWIYPETYSEVGAIVKILALGGATSIVPLTIKPIILASGNSFRPNIVLISRIVLQILMMYFGNLYFGFQGILYGIALSEIATYPTIVLCIREYGVWMPIFDSCYIILCFAVGVIGQVI